MDSNPQMACTVGDHGKPVFSFSEFVHALVGNASRLPNLVGAYVPPKRLHADFREKIMIAVSGLNKCRHCTAIHSAWGSITGLSDAEVESLVDFDPGGLEPRETVAIAYARCLVAGRDTREVEGLVREHFDESEIERIAAVAKGIDFANRCGNTWDAFEGRLLGQRTSEESSLSDELLVLATLAPFGLPFLAVSKALRTLREQPDLE